MCTSSAHIRSTGLFQSVREIDSTKDRHVSCDVRRATNTCLECHCLPHESNRKRTFLTPESHSSLDGQDDFTVCCTVNHRTHQTPSCGKAAPSPPIAFAFTSTGAQSQSRLRHILTMSLSIAHEDVANLHSVNGVGVQAEDTRICVVMVGLPARGKSLIAQKGTGFRNSFFQTVDLTPTQWSATSHGYQSRQKHSTSDPTVGKTRRSRKQSSSIHPTRKASGSGMRRHKRPWPIWSAGLREGRAMSPS